MQHIEKPGDSNKNTDRPRSVYIATYGCQMNVRDSEVIAGLLRAAGFKLVDGASGVDAVIFNTCSVRQHAEEKVWSEIGRFKTEKRKNQKTEKPIIGIVGCMAQNYKEKIFTRAPAVDFVVGPGDIHKIPQIISKLSQAKSGDSPLFLSKIWETEGEVRPEEIYHSGFYQDKDHAFVVISEGCSNFCSYCVVPYVRGALRHRRHRDIIREIKEAIDKGITKVTLLGQNVNSYRDNDIDFVKLVELVELVKGLKEFSFITSHPKDTSSDLFRAMRDLKKIKKCLHLPVQSGSDRILKLMNRGYTRKFYLDLAADYRKMIPGAVLTTDIILGFPTETQNDFMDTYNLARDTCFDAAYIFKYSPRPHTEAEKLNDGVPKEEKEKRHKIILDLQRQISRNAKSKT